MNLLPLLDSVQFHRAFSLGANVTLLAANTRNDKLIMKGSGIYTPFSATYHHALEGDPEEGRLLVARVPVLDPLWAGWGGTEAAVKGESTSTMATDSGYCHQNSCVESSPRAAAPSASPSYPIFISSMMYDPFKFVLLNETEGELRVCDGNFCCRLQYRRFPIDNSKELYALGAFAGTHTVNGRYALQVGIRGKNDNSQMLYTLFHSLIMWLPTGVCSSALCRLGRRLLWTGNGGGWV